LTVHVNPVPDVSAVSVDAPQPFVLVTPLVLYDHETVTFDLNHPPQPPPLQLADGGSSAEAAPGKVA